MAGEDSFRVYSVTITGLEEGAQREDVARAIRAVTPKTPLEEIVNRLGKLPWTMTRSASERAARKLRDRLTEAGALIQVDPPLEGITIGGMERTVALPPRAPMPSSFPPERVTPPSPQAPSLPATAALEMKPLSLGGILDRTFNLCRDHFWRLLGIVIIPWVVGVLLVAVLAIPAALLGLWGKGFETLSTGMIIVLVLVVPVIVVIIIALAYLSSGATIHAVSLAYSGRSTGVLDAYRAVYAKLGRFLLTTMLFVLVILAVTLGCFLVALLLYFIFKVLTPSGWWSAILWPVVFFPPIYAFPKLILFDKVVIIEDLAYMEALKRSWSLLTGRSEDTWPKTHYMRFIVLFNLLILIQFAISMIFKYPELLIKILTPKSFEIVGTVLAQMVASAGGLVWGMFLSVCMVVFYYDLRIRKEGLDLQMLMETISSED